MIRCWCTGRCAKMTIRWWIGWVTLLNGCFFRFMTTHPKNEKKLPLLWWTLKFFGLFPGCFWVVLESILLHYTTLECTTEWYKKSPKPFDFIGFEGSEPGGIRTHDLLIRSQLSYRLKPLCSNTFGEWHIPVGLFLGCVIRHQKVDRVLQFPCSTAWNWCPG